MTIRILHKWDYKTHEYKTIAVPEKWNCKLHTNNMVEIVNCPHCGKELPFGKTFTSLEIHNALGMGYAVCKGCHREELKRKMESQWDGDPS